MSCGKNSSLQIAVNSEVKILAETEDWLVVDKPAPLLVHPTNDTGERTLWHILNDLLAFELSTGGQLSLINRLDRETSGLTLAAKSAEAARLLGNAMQAKLIKKEYVAWISGHPKWDKVVVNEPIIRKGELEPSRIWVKQMVSPEGKDSRTEFELIRCMKGKEGLTSLVLCRPITGRMHQIRVHLAYLGNPIVGDKIYGPSEDCYLEHIETGWTKKLEKQLLLPRHALHACLLEFPYGGKLHRVESRIPEEWKISPINE